MRNLPKLIGVVILILLAIIGVIIYQKSQVKPSPPASTPGESMIKKVDLTTQPDWVQKLTVSLVKGVSANGLSNFTFTVSGMPQGLVQSLGYVAQYQTSNKGTQGALSTTPLPINGAMAFTKTIDLGTCSTKSCVRHDGVSSVDLELDFTTSSGDKFTWEKTLDLK